MWRKYLPEVSSTWILTEWSEAIWWWWTFVALEEDGVFVECVKTIPICKGWQFKVLSYDGYICSNGRKYNSNVDEKYFEKKTLRRIFKFKYVSINDK